MKNLYIHGHFISDNYGDFLLFYVLRNVVENVKISIIGLHLTLMNHMINIVK